ncbi:hypothetical protein MLD38_039094 [Melastoma candidum]|uniref:Uncharacterized protein n=1 Tax=Melastoma candidum TaxID=119954 RepID=A0ACB9L1W1_9MYRT|nr:hypothetical protein MLD38_039094 [Melastoma candidum]
MDVLPLNIKFTAVAAVATVISHGIEVVVEFKPVEHLIEPHNNDHPIQCPLPEPSILSIARALKHLTSSGHLMDLKQGMHRGRAGQVLARATVGSVIHPWLFLPDGADSGISILDLAGKTVFRLEGGRSKCCCRVDVGEEKDGK